MFVLLVDQYVLSPTYEFLSTEKFSGDSIYNPYKSINPQHYTPSNFHAHATLGLGLMNGKGTSNEVWKKYNELGYGFHAISQYQFIDKTFDTAQNYVPVYEHGYNFKKTHQLVINANHVTWKDYIFPQTLENKQAILSQLAEDTSAFIVLNHPDLLQGYRASDLKFLKNYDCLELLNPAASSFAQWDTALSNGNNVSVIGNDDLHDIHNNDQVGRFCNLIQAPSRSTIEAMSSLKKGNNVIMWLPQVTGESLKEKLSKIRNRQFCLQSMDVLNDQLQVSFDKNVKQLEMIGQGGSIVWEGKNIHRATIPFTRDSSYLRCVFETYDGIKYILNPVFRHKNGIHSRNFIAGTYLKKMPGNSILAYFLFGLWLVLSMWYFKRSFSNPPSYLLRKRFLRRV